MLHTVAQGLVWLIPAVLLILPKEWQDLTLSGALSLVVSYLNLKFLKV